MSRKLYGISASLLTLAIIVSISRGDDKAKPADQPAMDAYMKATQPGPEHALLQQFVGDWDAHVKLFNPDGSPQGSSKGVMHVESILGGRFIQTTYSGEMDMGDHKMPFKGVGLGGYDNGKKKYQSIWIDEMSTGMMMTEGDAAGDTLTLEGTITDPMSGKAMKVKEVEVNVDKDHHKYELHMQGEDGKMAKVLEILYTRKS